MGQKFLKKSKKGQKGKSDDKVKARKGQDKLDEYKIIVDPKHSDNDMKEKKKEQLKSSNAKKSKAGKKKVFNKSGVRGKKKIPKTDGKIKSKSLGKDGQKKSGTNKKPSA